MAVERRLIELIGPVGGKLHTARSRNDQVALDLRLYVRDAGRRACAPSSPRCSRRSASWRAGTPARSCRATRTCSRRSRSSSRTICSPTSRCWRATTAGSPTARRRADVLPLGAGALAGTTFPIDRAFVARQLGFRAVSENSLDAVCDRDFAAELLAALAILGMHLSRFADEIVLWSSQQFGFVELPDAFATGSSMMPQKKNPDVAELIRGKSGRVYGNLVNLLTVLKGLPLAYNRDLQEDKAPLFDSVDTVRAALEILTALVPRLHVRTDRMRAAAGAGYTLATELADYLASKGMPFREAHGVVGAIVQTAIARQRLLEDFSLAELRGFSPAFGRDVKRWLTHEAAVQRRRAVGGTSPANVERRLKALGV